MSKNSDAARLCPLIDLTCHCCSCFRKSLFGRVCKGMNMCGFCFCFLFSLFLCFALSVTSLPWVYFFCWNDYHIFALDLSQTSVALCKMLRRQPGANSSMSSFCLSKNIKHLNQWAFISYLIFYPSISLSYCTASQGEEIQRRCFLFSSVCKLLPQQS